MGVASSSSHKTLELGDEFWTIGRLLGRGAFGDVFLLRLQETDATSPRATDGDPSTTNNDEPTQTDKTNSRYLSRGKRRSLALTKSSRIQENRAASLCLRPNQLALKMMAKRLLLMRGEHVARSALNERSIMMRIPYSPFVVNMRATLETNTHLLLVLDLMEGGDLGFHMNRGSHKFDEAEIRFIAACLILSLEHLHRHHIVHRDLKPDNVMLRENGYAAIGDFNVSKCLSEQTRFTTKGRAGSLNFMAPEVILSEDPDKPTVYSFGADVWSLGVLLFYMIQGQSPWVSGTKSSKSPRSKSPRSKSPSSKSPRSRSNSAASSDVQIESDSDKSDQSDGDDFQMYDGKTDADALSHATKGSSKYARSRMKRICTYRVPKLTKGSKDMQNCLNLIFRPPDERATLRQLKYHRWFRNIDWKLLARGILDAPWRPPAGKGAVRAETLLQDEFQGSSVNKNRIVKQQPLTDQEQEIFRGWYEYVEPSILGNALTVSVSDTSITSKRSVRTPMRKSDDSSSGLSLSISPLSDDDDDDVAQASNASSSVADSNKSTHPIKPSKSAESKKSAIKARAKMHKHSILRGSSPLRIQRALQMADDEVKQQELEKTNQSASSSTDDPYLSTKEIAECTQSRSVDSVSSVDRSSVLLDLPKSSSKKGVEKKKRRRKGSSK